MKNCEYCQRLSLILRELEVQQEIVLSNYILACTSLKDQILQPSISFEIKLLWARHVLNDRIRLDSLSDRLTFWNKACKKHIESGHLTTFK